MQRQTQVNSPALPTKVSKPLHVEPSVRFGEGHIAPRIAMHHAKELQLPQKISKPLNGTQPAVRFGEGHIAPKIAMHHSKEIK